MVDKPVKKYVWARFRCPEGESPVGHTAILQKEEYKDSSICSFTTQIVAYDETMGIFETVNTVYVPA